MKIITTSDTHGFLPEIPDCDVLIHSGDIMPDFVGQGYGYANQVNNPISNRQQLKWLDEDFREWLTNLQRRGIKVVGTWGNHDFAAENRWDIDTLDLPWTLLIDEEIFVGPAALRVYGTPWVPKLQNWAFYGSDEFLKARADAIPEGLDILVSHGPPKGTADLVGSRYTDSGQHVGDPFLRDRLDEMQAPPEFLVCGHIHEGFGVYKLACGTTVYSVSYVDEAYQPTRLPCRIWGL